MNGLDFFIRSLATYRLAHLVVHEDGPFNAFKKFREKTEKKPDSVIAGIVHCVLCLSVWIGGIAALPVKNKFVDWIYTAFTMSAVATIFKKLLG